MWRQIDFTELDTGLESMAFFAEISGAPDINYQVQERLDWSQVHI